MSDIYEKIAAMNAAIGEIISERDRYLAELTREKDAHERTRRILADYQEHDNHPDEGETN